MKFELRLKNKIKGCLFNREDKEFNKKYFKEVVVKVIEEERGDTLKSLQNKYHCATPIVVDDVYDVYDIDFHKFFETEKGNEIDIISFSKEHKEYRVYGRNDKKYRVCFDSFRK